MRKSAEGLSAHRRPKELVEGLELSAMSHAGNQEVTSKVKVKSGAPRWFCPSSFPLYTIQVRSHPRLWNCWANWVKLLFTNLLKLTRWINNRSFSLGALHRWIHLPHDCEDAWTALQLTSCSGLGIPVPSFSWSLCPAVYQAAETPMPKLSSSLWFPCAFWPPPEAPLVERAAAPTDGLSSHLPPTTNSQQVPFALPPNIARAPSLFTSALPWALLTSTTALQFFSHGPTLPLLPDQSIIITTT